MINTLREWWFLWRAWRRSRKVRRYLNAYLSGKERAEQKAREAWEDYIDHTYFDAHNRRKAVHSCPDVERGGEAVRPSKNPPREKP